MKTLKRTKKLKMLPANQQAHIKNSVIGGCQIGDCCDIQPNNPWCIFRDRPPKP